MWGRSSRAGAAAVAIRRPAGRETDVRTRSSRSVTFPAFTTPSSSVRLPPRRATPSRPSFSRLTTAPGARTTTTTPSRSRTRTRAPASGRELRRTSASWSPGSASRGTLAETRRCAVACGARLKCVGRTLIHRAADRGLRRLTICGRPRRSRANPAKATSTTRRFVPGFLIRTVALSLPRKASRAGAAVNAKGLDVALVPAEAGTSARTMAGRAARFIAR